jgi:hypothetical protein
MKVGILILLVTFPMFYSCDSQNPKKEFDNKTEWNWSLEDANTHAQNFNDSAKWELKTLKMEVDNLGKFPKLDLPLYDSPFPTPNYSSPGNGNGSVETEIAGKKIIGHNVIIGKGEHSKHLFNNASDKYITYFTILVVADGQEKENPVLATSRNHPHYLSQGSLNTSTKSRVDWVAVQLADKNAYAIINSRLFDLEIGRLILVAPQKDGSIRFYQTKAPPMNAEEREKFIENLKSDANAIDFFKNENNI